MKKITAVLLVITILFSFASCGLSRQARNTISLIDSIGVVSLGSKSAIEAAESAYSELSDEDKEVIENYETLKKARKTYNKLAKEEKARIEKENNKKEAKKIDDAILNIGDFYVLEFDIASNINRARKMYDNAKPEVKKYVEKLEKLEAMEDLYKRYVELATSSKLKAILDGFYEYRVTEDGSISYDYDDFLTLSKTEVKHSFYISNGEVSPFFLFVLRTGEYFKFNEIEIITDEDKYTLSCGYYDVETASNYRSNPPSYFATYLKCFTGDDLKIFHNIASAEKITIRFSDGEYYYEHDLNNEELKSLNVSGAVYWHLVSKYESEPAKLIR